MPRTYNGSHGIQRKTVTAFRGQAASNAQVSRLAKAHTLVDPMHDLPTGPDRTINEAEIAAQNPKGTSRLLKGVDVVFRASCRTYAGARQHP